MEPNAKQQVAEKLRSANSVLVTVSENPTVDQLSAALGLALMLNALDKHTTAVFSGKIPNTMEFMEPGKTFENSVDGLRDFIISLDKEKADKLRYKVEDDVVKIFITPFRDAITDKDLRYSQGDYNVDLVVALGVHNRDQLDGAITSHGRILHDATIVTINSGDGAADGNLGSINWGDTDASCLCEMLVSISEALQGGIIDKQMSTAFLTGIVSATERFKNSSTTPKIMTMAAQLMAAGANQQLIATNLQIDVVSPAAPITAKTPEVEKTLSKEDKVDEIIEKINHSNETDSNTPPQDEKTKDSWHLGGDGSESQPKELGSMNEESLNPEIVNSMKNVNKAHKVNDQSPQGPKGNRQAKTKKKPTTIDDPSIEDNSFNASSAEVQRRNNQVLSHDTNNDAKKNPPKTPKQQNAKPNNTQTEASTPPPPPPPPPVPQKPQQTPKQAVQPQARQSPSLPPPPPPIQPSAVPPRKPVQSFAPPAATTQPAKKAVAQADPITPAAPPQPPVAPQVPSATPSSSEADIVSARQAVEQAVASQFDPGHNPTAAINAQPMSDIGNMTADLKTPGAAPMPVIPVTNENTLAIPGVAPPPPPVHASVPPPAGTPPPPPPPRA